MDRKHMIAEGDRSGVVTPSRDEKARERLRAAAQRLDFMVTHWPDISDKEFEQEIEAARDSIAAACSLRESNA